MGAGTAVEMFLFLVGVPAGGLARMRAEPSWKAVTTGGMTHMAQTVTERAGGTRGLLACGVVGGPLFSAVVVIQQLTRDGFDSKVHALSQLSLGELGWLQITNFILTGVLFIACAVGMRRVLAGQPAGRWGPRLYGIFGAALIWGGVFVTDPAYGFPPGTPPGAPDSEDLTWHGILHAVAPVVAGVAIVAACAVFARRFFRLGEPGWAWYSIAAAVGYLVVGFASFPAGDFRLMLAGGILVWSWASVVALRLLIRPSVVGRPAVQAGT